MDRLCAGSIHAMVCVCEVGEEKISELKRRGKNIESLASFRINIPNMGILRERMSSKS